jgi:flagellar hook-associated protein 2
MGTITFSGLATGINTGALIDELMKIEHRPVDLLAAQKSDYEGKLSLFNELRSKLTSFSTAANALSTSTSFFIKKATSSNESVLTATAGSNAGAGSHNITVSSLAGVTTQASANFSASTSNVRQGTLAITVGTTVTNVTVDGTNNTLAGLRDAINGSGAAVTASIVQVDASNYRLVVTGKDTGTANAVTLDESGLTTGTDPLPGFSVTQAATDATLTVDGIAITRSTNTLSDVIAGVTLSLKSTSASPVQVAIDNDNDSIKKQFNDFVSAYNAVASFIYAQTKYDASSKTGGPLISDSTIQSVRAILHSAITKTVAGSPASVTEIGVTTQSDGTLSVDDAKLSNILGSNPTGLGTLFTDATDGIAKAAKDAVDNLTRSTDGLLTVKIDGTEDTIDDLGDSIDAKEAALDAMRESLTRRFAALEALISKLKGQGDYLSAQVLGLSKFNS